MSKFTCSKDENNKEYSCSECSCKEHDVSTENIDQQIEKLKSQYIKVGTMEKLTKVVKSFYDVFVFDEAYKHYVIDYVIKALQKVKKSGATHITVDYDIDYGHYGSDLNSITLNAVKEELESDKDFATRVKKAKEVALEKEKERKKSTEKLERELYERLHKKYGKKDK